MSVATCKIFAAIGLIGAAMAAQPASAQYSSSYYGGYNSPAMQQIRRNMITNAINHQTANSGTARQRTTHTRQPTRQ